MDHNKNTTKMKDSIVTDFTNKYSRIFLNKKLKIILMFNLKKSVNFINGYSVPLDVNMALKPDVYYD